MFGFGPSGQTMQKIGDHDEESPAAERLEPVGTQQSERLSKTMAEIPEATQLDDGGLDLPTAVLRYLGSLPQSIGKDIELPLPQNPDEVLLVLFPRENISVARQKGYQL
jgi:hypothetical protein